ncbi:T9SS type A sorting domain-containing protein [Dyadobacter crusticola]|uniref:T9SS type A sorting domain-containing protein n=1 Tax=Dyadobacter crusticola TaxID=292407 RepID=UPI00068ACAF4|nr:T9SS type A sorting domain-containing protein [Dyadobacter crusticola]
MSFLSNYLNCTWTGSQPIDLDPGEELDLIGFELWAKPTSYELDSPNRYLGLVWEDPMYSYDRDWLIEVDGVSFTEGNNRFYSTTPSTTVENYSDASYLSFKTFTLESMPVKLATFEGTAEGHAVNLKWTTTEEANSDYFEVQHSSDGKSWNAVGQIRSAGESKIENKYFFNHKASLGMNYYRLKMVDFDNTFAFSKIISVQADGLAAVFPNPVVNYIHINEKVIKNMKTVRIYDLSGKQIYKTDKVVNPIINTKSMQPGVFIVELEDVSGAVTRQKLLKN